MTTIAYYKGVMAGDTRAFGFDRTPIGTKSKVHRLGDGRLVGVSTSLMGLSSAVREWVRAGMKQGELPVNRDKEKADFEAMVVSPDGTCVLIDGNWLPSDPVKAPYYAIGSGKDFALAAFVLGCDAVKAVQVASKLDPWTGSRVTSVKHD